MSHSPKSLYDISLNVFCEFLHEWSQPPPPARGGKNQEENSSTLARLISIENHAPINLIFSSFQARPQWMPSSRPSSTDNLASYNNMDSDKMSPFKKSCHNLVSTIFGRKSLESLAEENVRSFPPSTINLYYRISRTICQDIIRYYQANFKINDRTLLFPLFDGDVNMINNFQVEDATQITTDGLKVLKKHDLVQIKMAHLTNCTITELINNLSHGTISNIESFSVPHCSLTRFNKLCIILSLTRLVNLLHLDVSYCISFNNQCLEIITDHLINLKSLNLTSTKISILKPLLKLSKLSRLDLHDVALTCKDEYVLGDLVYLEHLDISDARFVIEPERYVVYDHLSDFFPKFHFFKKLTELDISGRRVSPSLVRELVKHRLQQRVKDPDFRPLKFLGLMCTEFTFTQIFDLNARTKSRLAMTGNGKLIHVIQSLIRYKQKPAFIEKALYYLCQYTFSDNMDEVPPPNEEIDLYHMYDDNSYYEYDDETDDSEILAAESRLNPNEIHPYRESLIHLVVDIMEAHMNTIILILFSSGNLYNLTKNNPHLSPSVLRRVVNICIETLKHYSTEYHIVKNILLTLCSDRILQDITFDRFTCIRLVLDTLFNFSDISVNRLALGISAILAAKIPTCENILVVSQSVYLKRLLDLVQENYGVNTQNNEILLRLSLSALWNFTDEAPKTCETFIKHNGIELYVHTLVAFEGRNDIETKILGLLNNIAEVLYLRSHLIQSKLLHQLKKLIYSDHIDVSYFAIGILAQLASDPKLNWNDIEDFELDDVLQQMSNQIQSWPNPSFEMVAYRSFEPFMPLLVNNPPHTSISLWALWAIHHVCTKNPNKYCRMLHNENCIRTIVFKLMHRLIKNYHMFHLDERELVAKRLIDFVTIADDEFQKLSKGKTRWNCHIVHQWNMNLCQLPSPVSDCFKCPNKSEVEFNPESKLNNENCDCYLKYHLDHDPFLRLPSIILKSFHCFSPVPLSFDF